MSAGNFINNGRFDKRRALEEADKAASYQGDTPTNRILTIIVAQNNEIIRLLDSIETEIMTTNSHLEVISQMAREANGYRHD